MKQLIIIDARNQTVSKAKLLIEMDYVNNALHIKFQQTLTIADKNIVAIDKQ